MTRMADDPVVALMVSAGIKPSRQDWIDLAYGDEVPTPWTAENEVEVPEELQDWSKVTADDGDDDDEDQFRDISYPSR
jgi:hypothetical protein